MAIRSSRKSRSRPLLSDAYNDARPQADLGPGLARFRSRLGRRLRLDRQTAPPGRPPRGGRRHGRGRADRRPLRRGARRHRAFRYYRPGRQHDLGDAVRRLAAILAGDPRNSVFAWAAARKCSGSRKIIPPHWRRASAPRTTLSPTMALRDGEPYLAWGSPGGDQQDQWTTQFFLRHVHANMNLQEAIDAPAGIPSISRFSFWAAYRTARRAGG